MAMHSPAPSPAESTVNLLEVIASEDKLMTNLVINGVTNEKGETQYYISGLRKDLIHVPSRIVEPPPPRPLRNVPPCVCAVHQIFKKGLDSAISNDNIPWTKEDGLCFGKKYRPDESGAYSCKTYPGDKSCRRNPFKRQIEKLKWRKKQAELKALQDQSPDKKKRMYSIADFQPCGDEHGMGVCGGPWGTLHTLTPEELEELERQRKEILRAPPCGTKPGHAVCEGPWGAKIPIPKKQKLQLEETVEIMGEGPEVLEEEEEDEEEEEEEEEKQEVPVEEVKEKIRKRDQECYMSPESIAKRKKPVVKKKGKFIPDPNYHGYDDLWNIFRTAPSEKEIETEYEKSLKLSQPVRASTEEKKPEETSKKGEKRDGKIGSRSISIISKDSRKISHERMKKVPRSYEQHISTKLHGVKTTKTLSEVKKDHDGGSKEQKSVDSQKSKTTRKKIDEKDVPSKALKKTSKVSTPAVKMFTRKNGTAQKKEKPKRSNSRREKSNKISNAETTRVSKTEKLESKKGDRNVGHTRQIMEIRKKTKEDRNSEKRGKKEKKLTDNKIRTKEKGVKTATSNPNKNLAASINANKRGKISEYNKNKSSKQDKKKDEVDETDPALSRLKEIDRLKNMMKSSEIYPYDIEPATVPEEPATACEREFEAEEPLTDVPTIDDDVQSELPKKGPCGWRTKSEQELPTKKNLIYLAEPDYPLETVPMHPEGKPCICRENRSKKKVLLYNISGFLDKKRTEAKEAAKLFRKKKEEEEKEEKGRQVIDGVIYYTPPPSPRRSDEYVPEYELYESPYDMCLSKRKDSNLRLLEQHAGPKSLVSKVLKDIEPCGCNDYIDTYGLVTSDQEKPNTMQELDKARQELMESKSPQERWSMALKDAGLVDYFARCRDNLPCWLKCGKFRRSGCSPRLRGLKMKKPVCECKYERKILERKEEKVKWKKRQQRLKSLKKHAFVNVVDTARPIEPDTKLLISDVKRIPRDDEYIDDVKYCITGVAENYSMAPPKQIVGGLSMSTPVVTPEVSEHDISYPGLHRHWSPTKIPPGPLPRKDAALIAEKKRRQEALEEAYRQIYKRDEIYDKDHVHSCKETCDPHVSSKQKRLRLSIQEDSKIRKSITNEAVTNDRRYKEATSLLKTLKEQKKSPAKDSKETAKMKSIYTRSQDKYDAKFTTAANDVAKDGYKKPEDETREQKAIDKAIDKKSSERSRDLSTKHNIDFKGTINDLMNMTKAELKKMAVEGFVFAKLPRCFQLPQLQSWLMYRIGIVFTDRDKRNLMKNSIKMWNILDVAKSPKIEPPSLNMTKRQLRNLTYDDAEKLKQKIQKKQAIFHSRVRKARVMFARSMWNTMEYEKFPSTSFKQAYFTYMASKEADGHVFKPWHLNEVREMK